MSFGAELLVMVEEGALDTVELAAPSPSVRCCYRRRGADKKWVVGYHEVSTAIWYNVNGDAPYDRQYC
jgi:hypothetical protein